MNEHRPQLRIIAGPNGSGKTTFVREFLPRYINVPNFVNADLIAAGLAPFAPEQASLRAGRLMLEEIRRLAEERVDFTRERGIQS
jgi:predicted ABC-type ATPase